MLPRIRTSGLLLGALLLASPGFAQDDETKALQDKFDAKLQEEWLRAADWTTDYDAARATAAESGKVIFAYFTRSYSP